MHTRYPSNTVKLWKGWGSMRKYSGSDAAYAGYLNRVPGNRLLITFALALLAASLSGCWVRVTGNSEEANQLAKSLHDQMARGDLAGIYNESDQRFRSAVTRDKSDALFSSISRKLGAPQDCKAKRTQTQVGSSGTTINLVCETTFAKNAKGTETIEWIKSGNQFRLLNYHINSEELIER